MRGEERRGEGEKKPNRVGYDCCDDCDWYLWLMDIESIVYEKKRVNMTRGRQISRCAGYYKVVVGHVDDLRVVVGGGGVIGVVVLVVLD